MHNRKLYWLHALKCNSITNVLSIEFDAVDNMNVKLSRLIWPTLKGVFGAHFILILNNTSAFIR